MLNRCGCKPSEIVIFVCAGGENVGQIAYNSALSITKRGKATTYCLIGIGAHVPGIVKLAKSAKKVIAVDGCQSSCSKKTLKHAGVKIHDHIIVTNEGIVKKEHASDITKNDIEKIRVIIESKFE
ncbi:putative zinc-binding protein [Pseudobacteroides cellulosolvens]|uniref:DGC domain protein n=1 Tax=Pseudobacteroides cellulosolvens ATCC 35603 = DSM 2933 TaxID=398512 RepID=A0A0L6JXW8_9FIRM|nr:putative zinc-binding protein [Pseudobacteroides cellulosolvens]KNY30292.1 DGC domain protein [Pseudobacteroides cellulosolvens ATCC 35603 = DSM 2933]